MLWTPASCFFFCLFGSHLCYLCAFFFKLWWVPQADVFLSSSASSIYPTSTRQCALCESDLSNWSLLLPLLCSFFFYCIVCCCSVFFARQVSCLFLFSSVFGVAAAMCLHFSLFLFLLFLYCVCCVGEQMLPSLFFLNMSSSVFFFLMPFGFCLFLFLFFPGLF